VLSQAVVLYSEHGLMYILVSTLLVTHVLMVEVTAVVEALNELLLHSLAVDGKLLSPVTVILMKA